MRKVGIYARISLDIEGEGLGVERQRQDCERLAELRGWQVADTYLDHNISAFKRGVVRPEFERLLSDLESGAISGVVCFDLDRFCRQPKDLERAVDIYESRRGLVFSTVQGDINLGTADGLTMARVMSAFANKSSMDTSRRVKRKHLELARNGVPVGGNRPFGYRVDKKSLEPREAKLVQSAAQGILAGTGLHTICRQWNEAGVTTTCGNRWRPSVLRNLLRSPRLAGFRVYQGGIARHEDGTPVTGQHEPILDVETWDAVVALLASRSTAGKRPARRKYLLSGIVRCAACGGPMVGNADKKNDTFNYHCDNTSGGCGAVAISGKRLDPLITELVLAYLAEREVETDVEPFPGEAELEEVSGRLFELMNKYAEGELGGEVVFPAVTKLEDRVAVLRAERSEWLREHVVAAPTNASESWETLDTDQRRAVIQSVLQAVLVKRAVKRGRFDPGRAETVWRA